MEEATALAVLFLLMKARLKQHREEQAGLRRKNRKSYPRRIMRVTPDQRALLAGR
jgi:ribosomal protein S30